MARDRQIISQETKNNKESTVANNSPILQSSLVGDGAVLQAVLENFDQLSADHILQLQSCFGNEAVLSLLSTMDSSMEQNNGNVLQPKLDLSPDPVCDTPSGAIREQLGIAFTKMDLPGKKGKDGFKRARKASADINKDTLREGERSNSDQTGIVTGMARDQFKMLQGVDLTGLYDAGHLVADFLISGDDTDSFVVENLAPQGKMFNEQTYKNLMEQKIYDVVSKSPKKLNVHVDVEVQYSKDAHVVKVDDLAKNAIINKGDISKEKKGTSEVQFQNRIPSQWSMDAVVTDKDTGDSVDIENIDAEAEEKKAGDGFDPNFDADTAMEPTLGRPHTFMIENIKTKKVDKLVYKKVEYKLIENMDQTKEIQNLKPDLDVTNMGFISDHAEFGQPGEYKDIALLINESKQIVYAVKDMNEAECKKEYADSDRTKAKIEGVKPKRKLVLGKASGRRYFRARQWEPDKKQKKKDMVSWLNNAYVNIGSEADLEKVIGMDELKEKNSALVQTISRKEKVTECTKKLHIFAENMTECYKAISDQLIKGKTNEQIHTEYTEKKLKLNLKYKGLISLSAVVLDYWGNYNEENKEKMEEAVKQLEAGYKEAESALEEMVGFAKKIEIVIEEEKKSEKIKEVAIQIVIKEVFGDSMLMMELLKSFSTQYNDFMGKFKELSIGANVKKDIQQMIQIMEYIYNFKKPGDDVVMAIEEDIVDEQPKKRKKTEKDEFTGKIMNIVVSLKQLIQ